MAPIQKKWSVLLVCTIVADENFLFYSFNLLVGGKIITSKHEVVHTGLTDNMFRCVTRQFLWKSGKSLQY